jgi:hypothetical protein
MISPAIIFQSIRSLAENHWKAAIALAAAVLVIVFIYRVLVTRFGPADLTGSGITVGAPKIFDNRSLTLMMEGLNTNLQSFNSVSQNLTSNLNAFQQGDAVSSSNRLQLNLRVPNPLSAPAAGSPDGASSNPGIDPGAADPPIQNQRAAAASPINFSPNYGIGAPDALVDQFNLAFQVFNQRIVTERAVSDRVWEGKARLQIVLGFQVSIDPPEGAEDCAAVAEIGLEFEGSSKEISIVALIPQDRTYNVASYSSSANSIDGSIVSRVKAIGGSASRQRDSLYLHRDADTIAFERDGAKESAAFGLREPRIKPPANVFGWEFHPVLGRRTVSPGPRLMLAVIALPCDEDTISDLKVSTRAYWLSYDRKRQTTNVRWAWWPLPGRQGRVPDWVKRALPLPSGKTIEPPRPRIETISWVDTGNGAAVVLVEGGNFFSGTEVIIGGKVYSEKSGGLILKSDRALQVYTTIEALGQGDAVLNGRYGPSLELALPQAKLPCEKLTINVNYQILVNSTDLQPIFIAIGRADKEPFLPNTLRELPNPILYVNDQPLARPYAFEEWSSKWSPVPSVQPDPADPIDTVRVTAWAENGSLRNGAVLLFKVPFCGAGWSARTVLASSDFLLRPEMDVKWLGSYKTDAGLEIADLVVTGKAGIAFKDGNEDQKLLAQFGANAYPLTRIDSSSFLLSLPSSVIANHPQFILVTEDKGNFVLGVPRFPGASAKASTET